MKVTSRLGFFDFLYPSTIETRDFFNHDIIDKPDNL